MLTEYLEGKTGDEIREHVKRNAPQLCLNTANFDQQLLFLAVELLSEVAAQLADIRCTLEAVTKKAEVSE